MAHAIVSGILEKLGSFSTDKAGETWKLVSDVEEEIERIGRNYEAIQYLVEDAEEKQYLDKSVKHWLQRFKWVSYDMEDVLADWKIASQKLEKADHEVETSTTTVPDDSKVWGFFDPLISYGSKVYEHYAFATRIKKINKELDQIVEDNKFDLIKREIIKQPKRLESTSFVDVSNLLGRDKEKEDIIGKLLCGKGKLSPISTITMRGMGGLGKTALAQLIYNDPRIQTHFDKTIWVCVSDAFDLRRIARAILEELDLTESLQNTTPLQTLFRKISKNIKEKKVLLVLDDVWIDEGQGWEQLKAIFQSVMSGSMILVTTQKDTVAEHFGSSNDMRLDLLSDEICWLILSQKAFAGRDMIKDLEDIGREIAKKCKGLPLAAVTLGGLLQDKSRREEWRKVLESEIWELDIVEKYIFRPLLLSYYDLPSEVKQCFLYCAMFPKDYVICKDELIYHWMALGYLNSDDHLGTGAEYFKCLATHSFFQDFHKDDEGDIIFCKMHDIVHDFVLFLTDGCGFVTEEINGNVALNLSSKNSRHLRLLIGWVSCKSSLSIHGAEKLRSLVAICGGSDDATSTVLQKLLSNYLRFLELDSFCGDIKETFRDIGNLIHLRHLSLEFCYIRILPESVCELPNLQSLNLQGCYYLEKLPVGIGKLINLRYLCTQGCNDLTYYPKGIRNLTSLMRLSRIKVRADGDDADQFSFGDLEHLNLLAGKVFVEVIGDTIDLNQVERAKLCNKKHLKKMVLYIVSEHINGKDIQNALNPPSNLHVRLWGDGCATQVHAFLAANGIKKRELGNL